MAKPLSKEQLEFLYELYYENGMVFGRDILFQFVKTNFPELNISRRQIAEWLKKQEINQLHQPHNAARDFKSIVYTEPKKTIAIDIMDLQNFEVRQFKYLLIGVDMFSRKVYAYAMKNKSEKAVIDAMKKMLKDTKTIKAIRSDNDATFTAKTFTNLMQKKGIKQVFSKASLPQSNGLVERHNQTLKRLIQKNIELNEDYDWAKKLSSLVSNINKTVSKSTGTTPNNIEKEFKENNKEFIQEVYNKEKGVKSKSRSLVEQKFFIGDRVRIFQPNDKIKSRVWSKEIYKIDKVYKPKTDYGVYEYKVDKFSTKFKEEDLQKVITVENRITAEPELFTISKIIKPVIQNNKPAYEVKWKNYKETTIEPRDNLLKDIPKMINLFDKRNAVKFSTSKKGKANVIYSLVQ